MLAVNYTMLRDNMKSCMDRVTDEYEAMIVTRKNHKNVVIVSEESYKTLLETLHLVENEANYNWLMGSKKQLEDGLYSIH